MASMSNEALEDEDCQFEDQSILEGAGVGWEEVALPDVDEQW
jgi:hypothetical protein